MAVKMIYRSFLCLRVLEEPWVIIALYSKRVVDDNFNNDDKATVSKGRHPANELKRTKQRAGKVRNR